MQLWGTVSSRALAVWALSFLAFLVWIFLTRGAIALLVVLSMAAMFVADAWLFVDSYRIFRQRNLRSLGAVLCFVVANGAGLKYTNLLIMFLCAAPSLAALFGMLLGRLGRRRG